MTLDVKNQKLISAASSDGPVYLRETYYVIIISAVVLEPDGTLAPEALITNRD